MIFKIIQTQCLPQKNCMLTVVNDRGETGFLYFKDAQLIEVNLGSKWGQEAFTTIYYWKIVRFVVGEIPAGIKRTIWDPIEKMTEIAQASPPKVVNDKNNYANRFQILPGFVSLYEEENNQLYRMAGHDHDSAQKLMDLKASVQEMGQILGAGALRNFYIKSQQFQGWRMFLQKEGKTVLIFAEPNADSFDSKIKETL